MLAQKSWLLKFARDLNSTTDLSNTKIIACQHILRANHAFFEELFELGLKKENLSVIGKAYSTSNEVLYEMKEQGIDVSLASLSFDSHLSYDEQFEIYTKEFLLEKFPANPDQFDRIIIIDEGAELILNAIRFNLPSENIVGVEQTSGGINKLRKIELKFPVVNVARSQAKLILESPMIADTVISKIKKSIKKFPIKVKKILIMGNGFIGNSLYEKLKDRFSVFRYDINEEKSDFPADSLNKMLPEFDLILGCSGQQSLEEKNFSFLKKGAILASTSSSDREFDIFGIRRAIKEKISCHAVIKAKGVFILNCGFPVNFDGKKNSVPFEKIQLTFGLLLAGVCQAKNESNFVPRFIELNHFQQQELSLKFKEELGIELIYSV